MAINYDRLGFVTGVEKVLQQGLGHEFGSREADGFEFLAGADVEEARRMRSIQRGLEVSGGDLHRRIVFLTGEEVGDGFVHRHVLVARADFGQCFAQLETAAGAAAHVVFGEEGAAGSGEGVEECPHGEVRMNRRIRLESGMRGRRLDHGVGTREDPVHRTGFSSFRYRSRA